jgi:hypothetical protein
MEAASRGGMSYQQWNEGGHAQFVDPVWRAQVPPCGTLPLMLLLLLLLPPRAARAGGTAPLVCCGSRRSPLPTGVSCCLFALLPLEVGVTYFTHSMFLTFLLTCKLAWAVAWA